MRILTEWLREFVDIGADDARLAHDLTMVGMAVDAVENGALEVDITSNRPDAMNHYGMAREASVIYDRDLKPYLAEVKESGRAATDAASVEIADADLCARYSARVILGVKVGPSPAWMVERLEAVGLRSINNVADVTNYLLLELGHPLHAFDLDQLAGHKIIVRRARPGERLHTLDAVERRLTSENLVIADAEKPVAIAGVMGGLESGIGDRTVNVLLESAWFEPRSIRKTAKGFGMHTDASHRFERGADVNITALAADRAAALIREVAGGEILRGVLDAYPQPRQRQAIELTRGELDRILGVPVPAAAVLRILRRLGFRAEELGYGRWSLVPPTFRLDIEREIDIVEEVGRHYGFDKFPNRLPAWTGTVEQQPARAMERAVRERARNLGYNEAITISLMSETRARQYSERAAISLANPISAEAAVLRTSAIPGLVEAVAWNLNRGVNDVRLFEIGSLYLRRGAEYEEPPVLGLALSGAGDFYQLKGDLESLLDLFACGQIAIQPGAEATYLHPGRSATAFVDKEIVAVFGELREGFRQPVLAAEIRLDALYRRGLRRPSYRALSRFPAVDRDFSLLLREGIQFGAIEEAIRGLSLRDLQEIALLEIFRGAPVPAGHYSLLLRVRFQNAERTLSDAEVNERASAIAAALEKAGATLRI